MNSNFNKELITKALSNLGIKGTLMINQLDSSRFEVLVDNKYFGIFDTVKNTFVD